MGMSFLLSLSVGGFQYETDPTFTICCLFRTNIKVSPSMMPAVAQFRTLPSCNPTTSLLCQLLCWALETGHLGHLNINVTKESRKNLADCMVVASD